MVHIRAVAAFVSSLAAIGGLARARSLDPSVAIVRHAVGISPAAAPGRPAASGSAGNWVFQATGALAGPAAIDVDGRVLVATRSGQVTQLSPEGKVEWSRQLKGEITAQPVIGIDGERYVATATAMLVGWTATGEESVRTSLSHSGGPSAPLVPVIDGTLLVAIGRDVLRVEPDGARRSLATFQEEVHSLAVNRDTVAVLGNTGTVYAWRDPDGPNPIGTLSGRPTTPAVLAGNTLATVTDGKDLVAIDLDSGLRRTLFEGARVTAVTVYDGRFIAASTDGAIRTFDRIGTVLSEVAAWTAPQPGAPTTDVSDILATHAGVFVVAPGRGIAFAGWHGGSEWLEPGHCHRPASARAGGAGQVVLTCDEGTVAQLGHGARRDPRPATAP
jgi:hypothetical protein